MLHGEQRTTGLGPWRLFFSHYGLAARLSRIAVAPIMEKPVMEDKIPGETEVYNCPGCLRNAFDAYRTRERSLC